MLPRSLVLLVVLGLMTGCPRQTKSQPAAPPPDETDAPQPAEPEPASDDASLPPLQPGTCAEGGRLWDGTPEDCSYEHAGCCYDSAADACAAASCPTERCNVLESYPAQISCR